MNILDELKAEIVSMKAMLVNLMETQGDGIGRVFNEKQAAEYLGISVPALQKRRNKNLVPFIKNGQGHIRYAESFLKRSELGEDPAQLQLEMNQKFKVQKLRMAG